MRSPTITSRPTFNWATVRMLGLMALLAAPFAHNTIGAAEGATAPAPTVINTVCPMDGKPIDPAKAKMVMLTIGEGADAKKYNLAFCSEDCCTDFKKDPGAALKPWFMGPKGGDTRKGQQN